MPEYLAPCAYVEELSARSRAIEGVETATAAMLGATERGPLTPRLITSVAEYERLFGSRFGDGADYLPDAVRAFFENGGQRAYVCRLVGPAATVAMRQFGGFTVRACGPGAWGRRVSVRIEDGTTRRADGSPAGFRLRAAYWPESVGAEAPFDPWDPAATGRKPEPQCTEDFDDLAVDPGSAQHFGKRLEASTLVCVDDASSAPASRPPMRDSGAPDAGGAEGRAGLTAADYVGAPTPERTERQGLAALADLEEDTAQLVHAPHPRREAGEVSRQLVAFCEANRSCVAVIDGAPGPIHASTLDPRRTIVESSYAAYYVPWIRIMEPGLPTGRAVPPGGAVLGVFARTDTNRGVHKTPVNEIVHGAVGVEVRLSRAQQELLNPRGVNAIRVFAGRGILIWGARTLSADPQWKYVNVRRLMTFVERSVCRGLRWVVFEPNSPELWAQVRAEVEAFLTRLWRDGALLGSRPEQAFFVRCDRSTMSQGDTDAGRVVCEIGVAPVREAEFMIVRIVQPTAANAP